VIPIRLHETDREGFDEPVVELWRDDEFVGMVFHDGERTIVQVYPTEDGDVHDLELEDLLRALDLARAIVDPNAFEEGEFSQIGAAVATTDEDWEGEHPATVALLEEFDPLAAYRSEDGEGFFPRAVAGRFISRCEELGLVVVEMEGFDLIDGELHARPDLDLVVEPQPFMEPKEFRTYANAMAADTLEAWPDRATLAVAFVFQQPDGETIVA